MSESIDKLLVRSGGSLGLASFFEYGCRFLRTIVLARLLTPGGVAVVEVGDGQAEAVSGLLEAAGLAGRGVWADLAGRARCVVCGAPAEKCAAPEKKCLE